MRLLITGASGLLGSKVAQMSIDKGYEVYSGYSTHKPKIGIPRRLDVCDRAAIERVLKEVRPEVVVHAAALTNVDKCEEDKELAWHVNVEGTRQIVEHSKEHGAFLIYISTDYVFSGEKGLYGETDRANPVNYYGVTKLEGEKAVQTLIDEWCVARSSVIYGSTPAAGKVNFALWVLGKLEERESIKVITDQYVSPTLNTNLADMVLEIAESRLTGIYHLAGATPTNRYDFAQSLAKTFNLNQDLIEPAAAEEMNWKAKRPKNTSLDVEKASRVLERKPLRMETALARLKEELEEGACSDRSIPDP